MSHDELPETDLTVPTEASVAESAAADSEPSHDAATWAWATEHGAPEWASTEQLISWLARGELPPHTLVWKHGWGEWLPAMQVAELAAAFPRVTAGSRRVARTGASNDAPPAVPVAHYPRLRLLAKDVLSESPLPAAAVSLAPAQAERRTFRDRDQLQKDLVTSQVPAAAMLEAARAMKQLGAPIAGSSSERWSKLDLGRFGEQPPGASAPPSSPPSRASNTLSPHAVEVAAPAAPEPLPKQAPAQPSQRLGRWLVVGALVGSALGLLNVSWPDAGDLLALVGVSLAVPHAEEDTATPVIDTTLHALSPSEAAGAPRTPSEEAACMAPPEPEPTASASIVERTSDEVPAVLRVSDLPAQRRRALTAATRSAASSRGISQH